MPVQQDLIIQFLRSIKAQGKPAWQRLQAVRAVAFYASHVLHRPAPWISVVADRLDEAARAELSRTVVHDNPENEFAQPIDPHEPQVIQALRREVRLRHYSRRDDLHARPRARPLPARSVVNWFSTIRDRRVTVYRRGFTQYSEMRFLAVVR